MVEKVTFLNSTLQCGALYGVADVTRRANAREATDIDFVKAHARGNAG